MHTLIREKADEVITDLLSQCSDGQVAFFHKIFGEKVPDEKIESAINLIERTISKNEKDPSRLTDTKE